MGIEWLHAEGSSIALRVVLDGVEPHTVWWLWTAADGLTSWWPQHAEVNLSERTIHLSWPRMEWHLGGRIVDWQQERRLAFTWRWDHEPDLPERTVTVELEPLPDGAGTVLTLTHGEYGDCEVEAADRQSHIDGWNHFLPRLEAAGQTVSAS